MTTDPRSEAADAALEREHDSTEDTAADAALNAMADANHRANYDAASEDEKDAEPVTFSLPSTLDPTIPWKIPQGLEELYYAVYCAVCLEYPLTDLHPHCKNDHVIMLPTPT